MPVTYSLVSPLGSQKTKGGARRVLKHAALSSCYEHTPNSRMFFSAAISILERRSYNPSLTDHKQHDGGSKRH